MKYLETWKRLLPVLLLGIILAGCASANGKTGVRKADDTVRAETKTVVSKAKVEEHLKECPVSLFINSKLFFNNCFCRT